MLQEPDECVHGVKKPKRQAERWFQVNAGPSPCEWHYRHGGGKGENGAAACVCAGHGRRLAGSAWRVHGVNRRERIQMHIARGVAQQAGEP